MFGLKIVEVVCLVQILSFIPTYSQSSNKVQDRKFCFFATSELIYENVMKQVAPTAVCEGGGRLLDNKVSLGGVQGVVEDFDSVWGAFYFVDEIDYPSILRYAQSRSQLSFMSQARVALPKMQIPAICRTVDLGIISSGFPLSSQNGVAFETSVAQYVERMRQLGVPEKYLRKLNTAQKWVPANIANAAAGQKSERRRVTWKIMNQKSSKRFIPYPNTPYPSADDIGAPEQEQPSRSAASTTPTITNQVTVESTRQESANLKQGVTQIVTQKQAPGMPAERQVNIILADRPIVSVQQNIPPAVGAPPPSAIQKPLDQNCSPEMIEISKLPPPQTPTEVLGERSPNPRNPKPLPLQHTPSALPGQDPVTSLESLPVATPSPQSQFLQETPREILNEDFGKPVSQQNSPTELCNQIPSPRNPKPLPLQHSPNAMLGQEPLRPIDNLPLLKPQSPQESPREILNEDFSKPRDPKPLCQQNSPPEVWSQNESPPLPNSFPTDSQSNMEDMDDQPVIRPRRRKSQLSQKPPPPIPGTLEKTMENEVANPQDTQMLEELLEDRPSSRLQNTRHTRKPTDMLSNNEEMYGQPRTPTKPEELSPPVLTLQFENSRPWQDSPESRPPNTTPTQYDRTPDNQFEEMRNPQAPQQNSQNPLESEETLYNDSDDQPTETQGPSPTPCTLRNNPTPSERKPENFMQRQDYPQEILRQVDAPPNLQNIPEEIFDDEPALKPVSELNRPTEAMSAYPTNPENTQPNILATRKLPSKPPPRKLIPKEVIENEIRNRSSRFRSSEFQHQVQRTVQYEQPITPNPPQYAPELLEEKRENPMYESTSVSEVGLQDKPLKNSPQRLQNENTQIPQCSNLNELEDTMPLPLGDRPTDLSDQGPCKFQDTRPRETRDQPMVATTKKTRTRSSGQTQDITEDELQNSVALQDGLQEVQTPLQNTPLQNSPTEQCNQFSPKPEDMLMTPPPEKLGQPPAPTPDTLEEELEDWMPQQNNPQELTKPNPKNITPSPLQNTPVDRLNETDRKPPPVLQNNPTEQCSPSSSRPEDTLPKEQIFNPRPQKLKRQSLQIPEVVEENLQDSPPYKQLQMTPTPLQGTLEEILNETTPNPRDPKPLPLQNGPTESISQSDPRPVDMRPMEQMPESTKLGQSEKLENPTLLRNNPQECQTPNMPPTFGEDLPAEVPEERTRTPRDFKPLPLQRRPNEQSTQTPQNLEDALPNEQIPPYKKSTQSLYKTSATQNTSDREVEIQMRAYNSPEFLELEDASPQIQDQTKTPPLQNTQPTPQQTDFTEALERKLEEKATQDLHKTIKEVLLASPSPDTLTYQSTPTATLGDKSYTSSTSAVDGQPLTSPREGPKTNPTSPITSLDNEAEVLRQDLEEKNCALLDKNAPMLELVNSESYTKQTESKRSYKKETSTTKTSKTQEADFLEPSITEPAQSQPSPNPAKKLIPGYTLGSLIPEFDVLSGAIEPTFLRAGSTVSPTKSTSNARPQQTEEKSTASASSGQQQSQAKSTASTDTEPQQSRAMSASSAVAGPQQSQATSMASAGTQEPCYPGSSALVPNGNPAQVRIVSTPNTIPQKVTATPISTPDVTGVSIQTENPNGMSSTTQLISTDGSNKVSTVSVSSANGSPESGTKFVGVQTEGPRGSSASSSSVVSVVN